MSKSHTVSEKQSEIQRSAKSNFGKKGWEIIILCAFMLFFATGTTTDGLNVTVPALAEIHNWDSSVLLGFATVSGLVSIAGMFIFGYVCHKKGPRFTAVLSLIIGGLSYIWYGNVTSITQYAIALCILSVMANVSAWISGGAFLANWFPKKKGLALGWATMGNNFASACFVPILSFLAVKVGMPMSISIMGGFMILLAAWALKVKSTPEEDSCTPDNETLTAEQIQAYKEEQDSYVSKWTTKDLLKTKELWFISISLGLYMMVTVGVMSQLVPRLTSIGFTQEKAVLSMTVCALIGVVGSYAWGVLDQKLTTKVAASIFGVWYGVAIIFNLIPNMACIYISIFMIGIAIGGNANFPVSLTASVFGRYEFSKAYAIINPLTAVLRVASFSVLAICLQLTGSLAGAYVFFAVFAFIAAVVVLFVKQEKYV